MQSQKQQHWVKARALARLFPFLLKEGTPGPRSGVALWRSLKGGTDQVGWGLAQAWTAGAGSSQGPCLGGSLFRVEAGGLVGF